MDPGSPALSGGRRRDTAVDPSSVLIHRRRSEQGLGDSSIALDDRGFVLTGKDAGRASGSFESTVRVIIAIGDVRSGSIKRVAASVDEGAQAVAVIHAFLAETATVRQ